MVIILGLLLIIVAIIMLRAPIIFTIRLAYLLQQVPLYHLLILLHHLLVPMGLAKPFLVLGLASFYVLIF